MPGTSRGPKSGAMGVARSKRKKSGSAPRCGHRFRAGLHRAQLVALVQPQGIAGRTGRGQPRVGPRRPARSCPAGRTAGPAAATVPGGRVAGPARLDDQVGRVVQPGLQRPRGSPARRSRVSTTRAPKCTASTWCSSVLRSFRRLLVEHHGGAQIGRPVAVEIADRPEPPAGRSMAPSLASRLASVTAPVSSLLPKMT